MRSTTGSSLADANKGVKHSKSNNIFVAILILTLSKLLLRVSIFISIGLISAVSAGSIHAMIRIAAIHMTAN